MLKLRRGSPAQEIVFDGFEAFEFSQFFPFNHNVAVEKSTNFFLFLNSRELRELVAGEVHSNRIFIGYNGLPDSRRRDYRSAVTIWALEHNREAYVEIR